MTAINRRTAIVAGACAAVSSVLDPTRGRAESATVPVVGRTVRWTSVLPNDGWIGGNADQIKTVLAGMKKDKGANPSFVKLIESMVVIAGNSDVYFTNLKDGVSKSDTITTLKTDVVDRKGKDKTDFSDEQYRSALAKSLAKGMPGATGARGERAPKLTSDVGKVELANEAMIGGRPAMTIKLRGDVENGSAFIDAINIIALPDDRWHVIRLTVDADHADGRLRDLDRMLRAIRYSR
jgi:hypothetical protein